MLHFQVQDVLFPRGVDNQMQLSDLVPLVVPVLDRFYAQV